MHEQPLQRFFKSLRERPVFAWERFQMRDVLVIDHPLCQAVFSRQGAQLLHFQPRGQKPWLWCAAKWPQVGAIRGGIPVCWPWYGRHPSENAWPSHGWARLIDWKLLDSSSDDDGVRLHWQLQLCDWQVDLHAHLGDTLELRLSTEHQDELPCQLSHALHAYWRIGHVDEIALSGLDGAHGYDQLNRQACQQEGELRVDGGCSSTMANCTSRITPGSVNCASIPATAPTPSYGIRAAGHYWALVLTRRRGLCAWSRRWPGRAWRRGSGRISVCRHGRESSVVAYGLIGGKLNRPR